MTHPRLRKRIENFDDIIESLIGDYPYYSRRTRDKVWHLGRGQKAQFMLDESELLSVICYPASFYRIVKSAKEI